MVPTPLSVKRSPACIIRPRWQGQGLGGSATQGPPRQHSWTIPGIQAYQAMAPRDICTYQLLLCGQILGDSVQPAQILSDIYKPFETGWFEWAKEKIEGKGSLSETNFFGKRFGTWQDVNYITNPTHCCPLDRGCIENGHYCHKTDCSGPAAPTTATVQWRKST